MPPGVDEQTVRASAGLAELDPTRTHGVSVVLGAGNITSIPPLDVLYELYAHNRVVLLKLNPITDPLLEVFTQIFAPMIQLGLLRIVTGASDVGEYVVHHEAVSHVHLTGSVVTHNAIVFGTGEEGRLRRSENRPRLTKGITSELGGVSPIIVLPGRWSKADLRFQAEHIVTQRLHNDGYNCVAGQIIVLSADWAQKDEFLAALRSVFIKAPPRPDYYPGNDQRVAGAFGHLSWRPSAWPSRGAGADRGRTDQVPRFDVDHGVLRSGAGCDRTSRSRPGLPGRRGTDGERRLRRHTWCQPNRSPTHLAGARQRV